MRPLRVAFLLLAALLATASVRASESSGPVAPIDLLLRAYGGGATPASRAGMTRTGEFVEPSGERRGLTVTSIGAKAVVKSDPASPSGWVVRSGFGYRADEDGSFEPITDASLGILVLQGTAASLPWILLDGRALLRSLPADGPGGAPTTIALTLNPRLTLVATLDPDTWLVSAFTLVPPDGGAGTMTARLADYRRHAGMPVPFRESYSVDGQAVGEFIASSVSGGLPAGGEADVAP